MAGVRAPLMSLDASGQLAKAIVFSKWKGRNYVRQLVTPANPRSGLQVGVRAAFKFETQDFTNLTTAEKANFQTLADLTNVTALNAFVSINQARARRNLGLVNDNPPPTEAPPAAPTGVTATAQPKTVVLAWTDSITAGMWGVFIFRSPTTGFTPDVSNLIAVVADGAEAFTDIGLTTGTAQFYVINSTNGEGELGTAAAEVTATPT